MSTTSLEHPAARKHIGLVLVALALVSMSAARMGFRCPIRAMFGIDCPGCGGTRALNALLRGDVRQAARQNLAVVVAGTAMAGYVIAPGPVSQAAAAVRARAERYRLTRWWALRPPVAACAATVLWGVARNLPWPPPSDLASLLRFLRLPGFARRVPEAAQGEFWIRAKTHQRREDHAWRHRDGKKCRIPSFDDWLGRHLTGSSPLQRRHPDVIVRRRDFLRQLLSARDFQVLRGCELLG
jgi:uncharacterized protein DUF2752